MEEQQTIYGKGTYYWQNGDTYKGDYVNGIREGYGVYLFNQGHKYEGHWKNNLRHGEGILLNAKGVTIAEGNWVKDDIQ